MDRSWCPPAVQQRLFHVTGPDTAKSRWPIVVLVSCTMSATVPLSADRRQWVWRWRWWWYLQDSLNDDSSIADCNINKVSSVHYDDYISTHQSVKKLNYTQNHPRTSWIEHRRQLHTGSGKKAPIHMAQLEQKYHFVLATISTHFFPTQKWRKLLLSEVFFATKKSLKCSCDQGSAPIVHSFIPLAQHTDRPTVA